MNKWKARKIAFEIFGPLKDKQKSKLDLMKEVKDVQAETEDQLKELVEMAEADIWQPKKEKTSFKTFADLENLALQMSSMQKELQKMAKVFEQD